MNLTIDYINKEAEPFGFQVRHAGITKQGEQVEALNWAREDPKHFRGLESVKLFLADFLPDKGFDTTLPLSTLKEVNRHTWSGNTVILFTIPLSFGEMAPFETRVLIEDALRRPDPDSRNPLRKMWMRGLRHPSPACTPKKYAPGERVRCPALKNRKGLKFYFVCTYKTNGVGSYRVMDETGRLFSTYKVTKFTEGL
jgi:hypothetical protein